MSQSLKIQVVSGPKTSGTTQDHELFFARRALALLKSRLGSDGLKKLLEPDIARADEWWQEKIQASGGQFIPCVTTLSATGISATQFMTWFKSHVEDLPTMLAAHPEHYINGHTVLETVGEHVTFVTLKFDEKPSDVVQNLDREKYSIIIAASASLQNGNLLGHACHQLRDLEDGAGMEGCFSAWIPAACGEEVAEMHRKHLAVEWSNWISAAQADLAPAAA